MAIYVKFEKPETIREFLQLFYNQRSNSYNSNMLFATITYHDQECTDLQCSRDVRSFDDLYEMIQTYFPETTVKQFVFELLTVKLTLKNTETVFKPYLSYCNGMGKIRFLPHLDTCKNWSEYQKKMQHSKYSWEELLKTQDINSVLELENFLNSN